MATLITGTRQFNHSFKEFLGLTGAAKATLNMAMSPEGDGVQKDIMFKRFASPEEFAAELSDSYLLVIEELEQGVLNLYPKLDKLNYLTRHLTEVRSCLKLIKKDESGNLKHSNFSFKNVSEDLEYQCEVLTQADMQGYLQHMEFALRKCEDHMSDLKRNIELTPQGEIPVPAVQLPGPYDSSAENPLAFFEYLISHNGLSEIKLHFIPVIEQDQSFLCDNFDSYDEVTETRSLTYYDHDYGAWYGVTTTFNEFLCDRLVKESNKSQYLINGRVLKSNLKEIKHFITLTSDQLTYLIKAVTRDVQFHKYEIVLEKVQNLMGFVTEKYSRYLPKAGTTKPGTGSHEVFKWIKEPSNTLSTNLYNGLKNGYIKEVGLDVFRKAFEGGSPKGFQKLKWIDKTPNKLHSNKVSLLYLFEKLCEKQFIADVFKSDDFLKKLQHVFVDKEGNELMNFNQSKREKSEFRTLSYRQEIDSIVDNLHAPII